MPKKLPKLPGLAFAIIIVLGLLCAAMALHITLIDGAEGAGPAQEIKRRPMGLIAYLSNPDDALPTPAASVPAATPLKFRMIPAESYWRLQYWEGLGANPAWQCLSAAAVGLWMPPGAYSESDDPALGRIVTFAQPSNAQWYYRGAVSKSGATCDSRDVSVADSELQTATPALLVTYGTGGAAAVKPPPGYNPNPAQSLETFDDLLYQAPGGEWVTQMLVSVAAAVVVMAILRSMAGLMIGIMVMPVSAFGMALIGYGSYWYVTVMALIFVLTVAAFTILTRRPSG